MLNSPFSQTEVLHAVLDGTLLMLFCSKRPLSKGSCIHPTYISCSTVSEIHEGLPAALKSLCIHRYRVSWMIDHGGETDIHLLSDLDVYPML